MYDEQHKVGVLNQSLLWAIGRRLFEGVLDWPFPVQPLRR